MAIWQFDMFLVPSAAVVRLVGQDSTFVSWSLIDRGDLWDDFGHRDQVRDMVAGILGKPTVRRDRMATWGEDQSSVLTVIDDGVLVREISARVDARDERLVMADVVVGIAEYFQLLIVTEQGKLLPADHQVLRKEIMGSRAWQFAKDPVAALDDISRFQS